MEVACAYLKVLEERLYNTLVEVEQWSVYISHICRVRQKTEHPELEPEEGESQEAKWEKSRLRVNCRNGYKQEIMDDIMNRIQMKGVNTEFMKQENLYLFLLDNLLYNVRKGFAAHGIPNELKAVNKIIRGYAKLWQAEEKIKVIKSKINHANIKKMAREKAYKMLFLSRDWNMETWIEIIFLKFYKEIENKKQSLKGKIFDDEPENETESKDGRKKGELDNKSLNNRKKWLISEGQKWFKEIGNNYTWQLTEEAVDALVEVEEEEKRLDLMNYVITVDKSKFSKVNWMIRKGYDTREALEIEAGLHGGQIIKKMEEEKNIEIYPFLICLFWEKSNISFGEFFKLSLLETTIQDNKIKEAYYSQAFGYNDILDPKKKGLEKDFSMDFNKLMYHIDMIARYGNKYEQTNHFWYTPMMNKTPDCICIELYNNEKIVVVVEYSSFIKEPIKFELPYTAVMWSMLMLKEEHRMKIVKEAGYETLREYIKYCAEMVVRKYCISFLGISYFKFQEIKCFAKITITIKPLIYKRPDGKFMLECILCFRKNKREGELSIDTVKRFEQLWDKAEDMQASKEMIQEKLESFAIHACFNWNKEAKVFSEHAMSFSDFYEFIYDKVTYTDESVYENQEKAGKYL